MSHNSADKTAKARPFKDLSKAMSSPKDVLWARHCDPKLCSTDPIAAESTSGTLPEWLSGVLYRTGPGVRKFGKDQYLHAMDGLAIIHAVEIRNGQAKYRSRALESEVLQKNSHANRICVTEFGTFQTPDPCMTILGKFKNRFLTIPNLEDVTDNGAVNLYFHGDELFTSTETNNIRQVDTSTLETVNGITRHSQMNSNIVVQRATAHPHSDPDGTLYNFGCGMRWGQIYHSVIKFPPPTTDSHGTRLSSHDQAVRVADVPARSNWSIPYFHSFGISENYFILPESPMTINVMKAILMNVNQSPPVEIFDWDPQGTSTFILVKRDSGQVHPIRYNGRAFACLHHINAYEEEDQLIVDMCVSEGTVYSRLYLEAIERDAANVPPSDPIRFVLPLKMPANVEPGANLVTLKNTKCRAFKESGSLMRVTEEALSQKRMDMPQINYAVNTKPYRYFYSVQVDEDNLSFTRLYKNDVETKSCVGIFEEKNIWVSEPVFVGRPGSDQEDNGVVLSLLAKKDDPTYVGLLTLDANTFQEVSRVNFKTKGPVTPSLHGIFNISAERVFQ
ncbi:carotenoid isomerooxygenase-like [Tigriopus californicus]|uniref:carotenoid isomerooxygenase-like n=1 Tax=Tigriopus californicus TaxID=6832 RepID=UPI0027DA7653|nr:carotenoid isomerooxygenase-like [Tigriopus californicus]